MSSLRCRNIGMAGAAKQLISTTIKKSKKRTSYPNQTFGFISELQCKKLSKNKVAVYLYKDQEILCRGSSTSSVEFQFQLIIIKKQLFSKRNVAEMTYLCCYLQA